MVREQSWSPTPMYTTAQVALEMGISVLPVRADGSKQPAVRGWKEYQQQLPDASDLDEWFASPHCGLALVTGQVSGGLIALDFDDQETFNAWRDRVRSDRMLCGIYDVIASGYEERTPKGGRHLLFRCPEAFQGERKPGNQKLALRPVPPPQRFETLAETREEGGLIIVYPSHGSVHPSGKPYYLLRGSIRSITTITNKQCELLYTSVRAFDETPREALSPRVPPKLPVFHPASSIGTDVLGDRPGDLFNADLTVTWDSLLHGWDCCERRVNGKGQIESYWRHPGKVGPQHSATTNADGTDRLYCFSPSVGLPTSQYLTKFEFYTYWKWNGNFKAAAKDLVEQGYTMRKKIQ